MEGKLFHMKKVLILSYFFPPCSLTAANRVYGWASFLHRSGYFPVIVTRNWDIPLKSQEDMLKSTGKEIDVIRYPNYEVHYLPYKSGIRDRIYCSKFRKLSKFLTFIMMLAQNFTNTAIPYSNIYSYSRKLLRKDSAISKMIITGNPFEMFRFGCKLTKEFKIPWIADYRDDWTTSELNLPKNIFERIIKSVSGKYEKKWVSTASFFTSVSDYYILKISNVTGKTGHLIRNGFFQSDLAVTPKHPNFPRFTIAYSGTLYKYQKIEALLDVIKELVCDYNINIRLLFIGSGYDIVQKERVEKYMEGYEQYFRITSRIPHEESLELLSKSHVLLMLAYEGIKGIPSSKIFEYIAQQKPVILYPSDNDVIEEILNETNLGIIANDKEIIRKKIMDLYDKYIKGEQLNIQVEERIISKYSRETSTKEMAGLLDTI